MPNNVVLQALRHAWLALEPLGVPMAVTGGLALATWRHVRATRDVDLMLGIEQGDAQQVLDTLRAAGLRSKGPSAFTSLGQLQVAQLLYEPPGSFVDVQIDVLWASSPYHREALRRRVPARLPDLDFDIAVLTCEDLILHKLLAGRLIDRADAAALLRANRGELAMEYLLQWANSLDLTTELAESWSQAFPGESLPIA